MTEDMNNSGAPADGFVEGPAYQIPSSMRGATNEENVLEVDVDGFEGPLDILLNLARVQKVDLKQISILQLAEQYLEFFYRLIIQHSIHQREKLQMYGDEAFLVCDHLFHFHATHPDLANNNQ